MSKKAKGRRKDSQTNKCISSSITTEDEKHFESLDIKDLLKHQNYQTKPNMSKFLKSYVDTVTLLISEGKACMWPKVHYSASKCIVRFKDGSTLIKCYHSNPSQVFLFCKYDEISLSDNINAKALEFFKLLEDFNFIRLCKENTGTGVFAPNLAAVNNGLEMETMCS